jgi:hypothetical protein
MGERPRIEDLLASDSAIRARRRALEDELTLAAPSRKSPSPDVPRRIVALAGCAAISILVLMVIGLPGGGTRKPPVLPALARVAEAAAEQPGLDTGLPYTYFKTRDMGISTSEANGQTWSVHTSTVEERWLAKDGSGRLRTRGAAPVWTTPADQEAWEAAGGASSFPLETSPHSEESILRGGCRARLFLGRWLSPGELAEIPTDPEELAAWLEGRVTDPHGGAGAGNGFSIAVRTLAFTGEILADPLASPELRAALYEAEGLIPGIESFGRAKDAIGRDGVAVGAESANSGAPSRYSLIFDPKTSQVLASETTMLKPPSAMPDLPTPIVSEAKLFLEAGSVGSRTELPDGRNAPLEPTHHMEMPSHLVCPS